MSASAKITAWHAPDADVLWYPIEAMRWVGLPVIVALARGGTEIVAEIRKHPRRKTWCWYQLGSWGGDSYGWMRSDVIELEFVNRETEHSPHAFRPLDAAAWKHPLPEPLAPAVSLKRPPAATPEPQEALDPHHGSDDWPYPGLRLGAEGAVPKSREECEARILRAFRTSHSSAGGFVGHMSSGTCADIPREQVQIALAHCNAERIREELRLGVAQPLNAVRSGWTPTKRDIGDWVQALQWLNSADPADVHVVELRAADPPWSFRQIAERMRLASHNTARRWYADAISHAFQSALRLPSANRADASAEFNGGGHE